MCIGDCRRWVSVQPLSFERPTARTHLRNGEAKIMKNIEDDINQSEHNILLFYGDRQAIKDLKLSACSMPLSCYFDDIMWGLWNNYNTYIVNLLAYMTANLMPVHGHVPTKFELSGRYTSFWINIRKPHQHCRNPIGEIKCMGGWNPSFTPSFSSELLRVSCSGRL